MGQKKINEMKNRKLTETIIQTKSLSFEKINKILKPLARKRKKGGMTQTINIRSRKESMDAKRTVKEQVHSSINLMG